jgi:lipid-A-disaccharide synthase
MRYYIISGEASGDMHGSRLIREIKKKDVNAVFRCWGGELMQNEGAEVVKYYKDLAFMGFIEVIKNIRTILNNISFCKKDIISFNPDIVILIDYPGFNLRIAKIVKKYGYNVCYYITPQIWAWNVSRVKILKKYVDKNLVILPFEKNFLEKYSCNAEFVGHPLLDAINDFFNSSAYNTSFLNDPLNLKEEKIIALLPGSRKQEIKKTLPIMLAIIPFFPSYRFIIAGISSIPRDFYEKIIDKKNVTIIFDKTYNLLKISYAALVTSGTATLETALMEVPEIVCYKANPLSVYIAKLLIKVNFISLVNLIMEKEIVKELIQKDFNTITLQNELNKILNDNDLRNEMKKNYVLLKEKLGGEGASIRAAEHIVKVSNNKMCFFENMPI